MEIPTDKIIANMERDGEQDEVLKIIKAQALEIRELQAVIVRLRDEIGAMGDLEEHKRMLTPLAPGHGIDFWAKRRMTAWKALPEPRVSWEDFKRTWKDDKKWIMKP